VVEMYGAFVAWILGVGLTLWISYLLIRGAVRGGVKRGIRDALDDPGVKLQLMNLIHPDSSGPG
jgi:hypothetical protein